MAKSNPDVLISAEDISARVDEIAEQISAEYADNGEIVLIGVLEGAVIFVADISRRLTIPRHIEFIAVSSSEHGSVRSGAVRLVMDVRASIEGKHVIVVEDIVDTGLTMRYLFENLATRGPISVKLCSLLEKPTKNKSGVEVDYLGFTIPDKFVIGYGLDDAGRYRNLPFVGVMEGDG